MPRESAIVASIVGAAKAGGWWTMKIHGGPYQLSGVPDVLCVKNGRAVFLEVKQPGKKPTEIQKARMKEISEKGGAKCAVVTSKEEAIHALQDHSHGAARNAVNQDHVRAERRFSVRRDD
jgi:hypothetical protein